MDAYELYSNIFRFFKIVLREIIESYNCNNVKSQVTQTLIFRFLFEI